jgi:acyl dehydratase
VYDKGKAAVLVLRTEAADTDGPLWTNDAQIFIRGEGGWGGDRGPSARPEPPTGEPDKVVERPIREDQALLYRLSGDWNPLHADPDFAAEAGFDRPILHGLCTYGITLKAVVDTLLGGEAETLRIRMWHRGDTVRVAVGVVERDDAPALTDTVVHHS